MEAVRFVGPRAPATKRGLSENSNEEDLAISAAETFISYTKFSKP